MGQQGVSMWRTQSRVRGPPLGPVLRGEPDSAHTLPNNHLFLSGRSLLNTSGGHAVCAPVSASERYWSKRQAADLQHDMHLGGRLELLILWAPKRVGRGQHDEQHHAARPRVRRLPAATATLMWDAKEGPGRHMHQSCLPFTHAGIGYLVMLLQPSSSAGANACHASARGAATQQLRARQPGRGVTLPSYFLPFVVRMTSGAR